MTCGIYLITREDTSQMYVGQSVNIEKRWKEHIRGADIDSSRLEKAMRKHGVDKFSLKIITKLPNVEKELNSHEKYWIKFYNTYEDRFHYNLTPGGEISPMKNPDIVKKALKNRKDLSGPNNPFYRKKHSDESKKKISEAKKGVKQSLERKINFSLTQNNSDYFRVSIIKTNGTKQGFTYRYQYYDENGKSKSLESVNIDVLERKVKNKGLEWIKLNKEE